MRKFAKALCVFVLLAGIATTARSGEFYGELALDGNPDDSTGIRGFSEMILGLRTLKA